MIYFLSCHLEDEKEDVHLFLVKKEIVKVIRHTSALEDEVLNIEENKEEQDFIIAITPLYFKEKNSVTARTVYKVWMDDSVIDQDFIVAITPLHFRENSSTAQTIYSVWMDMTIIFQREE